LVFASTEREIRDLADTLRKYGPPHTEILPLYARLSLNEQQRIFHPTGKGRRIIIATTGAGAGSVGTGYGAGGGGGGSNSGTTGAAGTGGYLMIEEYA
jgi:hypothetical protein